MKRVTWSTLHNFGDKLFLLTILERIYLVLFPIFHFISCSAFIGKMLYTGLFSFFFVSKMVSGTMHSSIVPTFHIFHAKHLSSCERISSWLFLSLIKMLKECRHGFRSKHLCITQLPHSSLDSSIRPNK